MARRKEAPAPKTPQQLEAEVIALLCQPLADAVLRGKLEELAGEPAFNGLTYLFGPELYRRNRVLFRPFLLNHFGTMFQIRWDMTPVRWKEHAAVLDAWLAEVDRRNDVELFRRLYAWKHAQSEWGGLDEAQWRKDLFSRFQAATDRGQRAQVLGKFDFSGVALDEATAVALYEADPALARPFILKHVPRQERWGEGRNLPEKLCDLARQRGDDALYFPVYRLTVPLKTWARDVDALASQIQDPGRLVEELERRHPTQAWSLDLTKGLYGLAKRRGRDVVPYLMKHLDSFAGLFYFGGLKKSKLLELARAEGWWDVWSALVRRGDVDHYNAEVLALVQNRSQPDELLFRRLVMLSGAASEWTWGRFAWQQIPYLKDKTAVALYQRFPDLVHGPFRKHVDLNWWHSDGLAELTALVFRKRDTALIDYLSSQAVLIGKFAWDNRSTKPMQRFLEYFEKLRPEPAAFARRVAGVLGQIPAYAVGTAYPELIKNNRLARLFFEESHAALLHDPRSVRDLLEAAEIQTQVLALRVLAQDDERARRLAADNLDLLQATLLRTLHRKSRLIAFRAVANAATTPDHARQVLAKAREAMDLPDEGYPKEHLLDLLAGLLQRWPELRGAKDQPVVYRARVKERAWV